MTILNAVCVAAGGALGALARSAIAGRLDGRCGGFPLGTFCANMLASIMLGILVALSARVSAPEFAELFLQTGFCATLSTFSSLAWQISHMLRISKYALAAFYGGSTLACSMALFEISSHAL